MSTNNIPFGTAGFVSGGTFNYYALCSDGDDIVSRSGNLAMAAAKQLRGAILNIDATGVVSVPALGTECNCILAIDCDATLAIAPCLVYVGGKFKADAVIWPPSLAHGGVVEGLRNMDIQIESVVFTDGSLVKTAPSEAEASAAKAVIAKNRAREKAADRAKPDGPGPDGPSRDAPWAYLTPDERLNHPELAAIHDREDEEEKAKENEKGKEKGKEKDEDANKEVPHQGGKPNQPTPPQHQKPKGGD